MKRQLFFFVAWAAVLVTASAALKFEANKGYRILCANWNAGTILVGSAHGSAMPVYYSTTDVASADGYWLFTQVGRGVYTIRNAQTGGYMTYDGERTTSKRYLDLTSEPNGDYSKWTITNDGDYCFVTNVAQPSHRLNVRRDSYIVGTYANTGSAASNELFRFIDSEGNDVAEIDDEADGSYGVTTDGMYWENTGLTMPVVLTTEASNPVLYAIKNVRSDKFVSLDNGSLAQTDEATSLFYFVEGINGVNIVSADGLQYVSGAVPAANLSTTYVQAPSGSTPTTNNTWSLGYYAELNAGYTLSVSTCSANTSTNANYWAGNVYWNDYNNAHIGFWTADGGSTFVFYSSDSRHADYLKSKGFDIQSAVAARELSAQVDSITFNGMEPVYDALYRTYMLPIPTSVAGTGTFEPTIRVKLKNANYTFAVDSQQVATGSTFAFEGVEAEKSYSLQVWNGSTLVAASPITFTYLPIVSITGSNFSRTIYHDGTIRVLDADYLGQDSTYRAGFRWRGATAAGYTKKAYAVKLRNAAGESIDRSFFGLRSDNNWILDAAAVDRSRMRNRVSTDLWLAFSAKPYYQKSEPKAINGTRGRFVEVLLNGQYAGLYCMTEKVDRKQLKLKKFQKNASTGTQTVRGLLYKSTSWNYTILMGHQMGSKSYPRTEVPGYNNNYVNWNSWECKYPDVEDGEPIDWGPLRTAVNLVASGSDADFRNQVAEYFDIPVWRDYYLFIDLLLATDNHGKNLYAYDYDAQSYYTIGLTPWDLDGTWGRRWDGSSRLTSNAAQNFEDFLWANEHGQLTFFTRMQELDVNDWTSRIKRRWATLRRSVFSADSLVARFAAYNNLFKASGAAAREEKRWNGIDGVSLGFDNEMEYLDTWIRSRVAALDNDFDYAPVSIHDLSQTPECRAMGGQGCIRVSTSRAMVLSIYNLDGVLISRQKVEAGRSSLPMPAGLYIVNRQKVIVK